MVISGAVSDSASAAPGPLEAVELLFAKVQVHHVAVFEGQQVGTFACPVAGTLPGDEYRRGQVFSPGRNFRFP
jgi:hypothetical protein